MNDRSNMGFAASIDLIVIFNMEIIKVEEIINRHQLSAHSPFIARMCPYLRASRRA
jgi:hypothetical protein